MGVRRKPRAAKTSRRRSSLQRGSSTSLSRSYRVPTPTEYFDYNGGTLHRIDPRTLENAPWRRMASFLEAIECERTLEGLSRATLDSLDVLLDFNFGFLVVASPQRLARPLFVHRRNFSETALQAHLAGFMSKDPLPALIPSLRIGHVNWKNLKDQDFRREFIALTGATHAFGLSTIADARGPGLILVVDRSCRQDRTREDMLTMAALYPHLHNLAFAITSPREHLALRLRPTFDAAGLTEREREVALILCDRLSVNEIADRLWVSPKTVAKHLEHIYLKLGLEGKKQVYERLLRDGAGGFGTAHLLDARPSNIL